jgi:hypothetical protein
MRRLPLPVALAAALLLPAPAAAAPVVSLPHVFRRVLPGVRARAGIPVLVPARADFGVAEGRLDATGGAHRGSYDLELGAVPHCGGADACFLASFTAGRATRLGQTVNVRLARGLTGHFDPGSCGASCAPPEISWLERGVRYSIQARLASRGGVRAGMVALADSAIRAGAR